VYEKFSVPHHFQYFWRFDFLQQEVGIVSKLLFALIVADIMVANFSLFW